MRSLLLAATALTLAVSAQAADVLKAPAQVPVPVLSTPPWAGFYVGGSVGGNWSSVKNHASDGYNVLDLDTSPSGFIGGGFVGYNWQLGAFVGGIESDINWTNTSGSEEITGKFGLVPFAIRASNHLDWLGTTRARLGYAFNSLLLYGTGGFAYGGVSNDYLASIGSSSLNSSFAQTFSNSSTRLGWTAGAGIEWMFAPHMTLRGEWLYWDLGTADWTPAGTNVTVSTKATGNIARAGVAYKF